MHVYWYVCYMCGTYVYRYIYLYTHGHTHALSDSHSHTHTRSHARTQFSKCSLMSIAVIDEKSMWVQQLVTLMDSHVRADQLQGIDLLALQVFLSLPFSHSLSLAPVLQGTCRLSPSPSFSHARASLSHSLCRLSSIVSSFQSAAQSFPLSYAILSCAHPLTLSLFLLFPLISSLFLSLPLSSALFRSLPLSSTLFFGHPLTFFSSLSFWNEFVRKSLSSTLNRMPSFCRPPAGSQIAETH